MQNLATHAVTAHRLPHRLHPHAHAHLELAPHPARLHAAHPVGPRALAVPSYALPLARPAVAREEIVVRTEGDPAVAALVALHGRLLLCTRAGELFVVAGDGSAAHAVGDVADEVEGRSGVLAAAASADGGLVVVVSPVKVLVLDAAAMEVVAEVAHAGGLVAREARVAWRADGECVAVVVEGEGVVEGVVVENGGQQVKRLELGEWDGVQGRLGIVWEPRVGGFVGVSRGGQMRFFERNGLRHLRSDFELGGVGAEVMEWSADSRVLAVAFWEGGSACVRLYLRCNYRWYCKKKWHMSSRVVGLRWDEDVQGELMVYMECGEVIVVRVREAAGCVFALEGVGAHAFVVDGDKVGVTNFSRAVLPPPMCHGVLRFKGGIEAMCAWEEGAVVAALGAGGCVEVVEIGHGYAKARVDWVAGEGEEEGKGEGKGEGGKRRGVWKLREGGIVEGGLRVRAPVFVAPDVLAVVESDVGRKRARAGKEEEEEEEEGEGEVVRAYRLEDEKESGILLGEYSVKGRVAAMERAVQPARSLVLVTSSGAIVRLNVGEGESGLMESSYRDGVVSGEAVSVREVRVGGERLLTFVEDEAGVLTVTEVGSSRSLIVSEECTSWCIYAGFLAFTTQSHLLYCALLGAGESKSFCADKDEIPSLIDALDGKRGAVSVDEGGRRLAEGKGATRPIDRGSRIVTAIPHDVSLVLQAPRGNLETICPRPVVFEVVDKLAKSANYAACFKLCRQQRVDMNHLVDADYDLFLENVGKFVEQVGKAGHLSVFMTFLRGDLGKINAVCDAIVDVLRGSEQADKYVNAILTGLVRREPADFSAALDEVRRARARGEEHGAAAVDYLFVLTKDEEAVYKHALGAYDLQLALFVAKTSQMDPALYSQELKSFSALDEKAMRHAIDMRLERYDRALRHLHSMGTEKEGECLQLCRDHDLYETGLELFRGNERMETELRAGYAGLLQRQKRFQEAAAVYVRDGDWERASASYSAGGHWQLAVSALRRCNSIETGAVHKLLASVADELAQNGRMKEAAEVRLRHLGDLDTALDILCSAGEWDAAIEAVGVHCAQAGHISPAGTPGASNAAVWTKLKGHVLEGTEALLSTLDENRRKLHDRRTRLAHVRAAKAALAASLGRAAHTASDAGSDAFSASTASSLGSSALSDVTFASRTSAATSVYTTLSGVEAGALSAAKLRKQAERRRRKAARKRVRQGDPREEDFLVAHLRRLAPHKFLSHRVAGMVRGLLFVGEAHRVSRVVEAMRGCVGEARQLPDDVLQGEVREVVEGGEAWAEASEVARFI